MSDFVFKILILIYWLASQERFNNEWQQDREDNKWFFFFGNLATF
jgi:hypothetical protein